MNHRFDAIFIGSGHNALIAAAYLARAGMSTLVLEKNDRPGGLVRTEELTLPGFKHDVYSSAHPLFLTSAAHAELGPDLATRGLKYLNTDLPTGVSMADGQTAVLSRSMEANIAEAERLCPGDGAALGGLLGEIQPYVGDVFGLFNLDLGSPEGRAAVGKLMQDPSFAALFFQSARSVVNRFQSPVMRAMLAPWAIHLGRTPDEVGSGLWVPLVLLALMGGGMALPEGGSEMLAIALAKLIIDHGGVIQSNSLVNRIVVENGRATRVITKDKHEFVADRVVVASVNPDQLYLHLLEGADIPATIQKQAAGYRYGRGCVQLSLALSEPPRFEDPRFARIGQPHLSDGLDGCTLACAQGMAGLLPALPTFTVDCPTNLDPSRAPAGKATMRVQVLEVPCRPRGDAAGTIQVGNGEWGKDLKQQFADRILRIVGRHIPNVPDAVIGMHITSPAELAAFSPNLGPGAPYGGSQELAQSYIFQPLPGQSTHRSIVPNLYTLGAATWPGHGINGGSGYIVAKEILR